MSGMISAVITVCAGALICSLLSAFVPEGTTKKTVALVIGAFMVCCLISPITSAISSIDFDAEPVDATKVRGFVFWGVLSAICARQMGCGARCGVSVYGR